MHFTLYSLFRRFRSAPALTTIYIHVYTWKQKVCVIISLTWTFASQNICSASYKYITPTLFWRFRSAPALTNDWCLFVYTDMLSRVPSHNSLKSHSLHEFLLLRMFVLHLKNVSYPPCSEGLGLHQLWPTADVCLYIYESKLTVS